MRLGRIHWMLIGGALLGTVLANWLGPNMIAWYFTPPIDNMLTCKPAIEWALGRLQVVQLVGMGGGLVLGLIAYFTLGRKQGPESELPTA